MIGLEFCEAEVAKSIKEMDIIDVVLALKQSTDPKFKINQRDVYHWCCLGFVPEKTKLRIPCIICGLTPSC